jgi:diguanylate cyclase (GGDEF)-like protein/PAS domain S-box-containing protein
MRRRERETVAPHGERKRPRGRDILTPFILITALLSMGLVAYGQLVTSRVIDHQAQVLPLADAARSRAAAAHLELTKAIEGDPSVDVQRDVFSVLRQLDNYIDAAVEGEENPDGATIHVTDPRIRADLEHLSALIQSFTALESDRWINRDEAGIGTRRARETDALYRDIEAQVSGLAVHVEETVGHDRAMLRRLNLIVLGILLLLFTGVQLFAVRTRRAIVRKNAELEVRVVERTKELAASEARTAAIVNTAVDAIVTVDEGGRIVSVNPSTERIFGWPQKELVGRDVTELMADDEARIHGDSLTRYLETGEARILGIGRETVAKRRDGSVFPIDISISEARVDGVEGRLFVGLIRDITERKRVEEELQKAKAAAEEAAMRDSLTGLWNHNRVIEILIEEMSRSERQGIPVSVAMVDLDRFKHVNDTYGHLVGDEVLREIAVRLGSAVRVYDSVGRFGGEEFVVVLPGTDRESALIVAERIREEVGAEPVLTSAGPLTVTASLGVVTRHAELANDATALLVAADSALYEAKESGRDRVEVAVP